MEKKTLKYWSASNNIFIKESCFFAERLVGVVSAESRPVVIRIKINILGVVLKEIVERIDLMDIVVLLGEHIAQRLPLIRTTKFIEQFGRDQHTDARRRRQVEKPDPFCCQSIPCLVHQRDMVIGSRLVKAQS